MELVGWVVSGSCVGVALVEGIGTAVDELGVGVEEMRRGAGVGGDSDTSTMGSIFSFFRGKKVGKLKDCSSVRVADNLFDLFSFKEAGLKVSKESQKRGVGR